MTRNLVTIGCLWVTAAALAMAQEAPPAPIPPVPAMAPAPAAAPTPIALPQPATPAAAPALPDPPDPPEAPKAAKAPKALVLQDGQFRDLQDIAQQIGDNVWKIDSKQLSDEIKEQVKAAAKMKIDAGELSDQIRDAIANADWGKVGTLSSEAAAKAVAQSKAWNLSGEPWLWAQQTAPPAAGGIFTTPPGRGVGRGVGAPRINTGRGGNSEASLFDRGENNLDQHNLDTALVNFNEVISRGGAKADGAQYYKAFTLEKMGRRDEAQSAIAELRKNYPNSRWLEDAKALEADLKSGGKASSEDDDIKLLALDGLMQTDPERAFPLLEGLIKGAHVPSLKKQAVFVLAKNSSPRAQALMEQIARGAVGDPDQQLTALRYVTDTKSNPARAQLLMDVYSSPASANDAPLRSVVIQSFVNSHDYDHLGQIAKTEKNPELRSRALRELGNEDGQAHVWQFYAAETTPEGKEELLRVMQTNGNVDKIAEVAKTDKDAPVRRAAVDVLATNKGANVTAMLVGIYGGEPDNSVKRQIISSLVSNHDAKSLIDLAKKEKDPEMKRYILQRLINIHSPEVTDFLLEILKP